MLKNLIDLDRLSQFWDLSKNYIDNKDDIESATGNPITLTDAANANAEELLMTIEPVQDLHGYTKPWSAGGGKNKFNEDTLRMGDYNNTTVTTRYSQNVSDRIQCTAGTSYIISAQEADITNGTLSVYVRVTDANNIILDDIAINNHALTTPLTVTANNNGYLTVIFGCTLGQDTTKAISLDEIKDANVMIRLATETDPTFEPYTNICPITGLTSGEVTRVGKNLTEDILVGHNITSAGYVEVNASYSLGIAKVVSGQSYIVTTNDGSGFVGGFYYDKPTAGSVAFDNTRYVIANKQFTAPITGYVVFRFTPDYTTPQLELGTTATDYEAPVTPATATITFGQTVYGGSVNFKTGEVTVTHGYTTIGDMLWSYESASTRFGAVLSDMKYAESLTALPPLKCSAYKPLDIISFNTGVNNAIRSNDGGSKTVWIRDTRYTDATEFKTAMASTAICYELATPTTLTLTPAELELLKGNNTITANGAEINIEYYPDNAIGTLAGRVDDLDNTTSDMQEQIATKASTTDVNTALATKANQTTITIPQFTPSQAGWRRICKIKPVDRIASFDGIIYVNGEWNNGQPPSASITVNARQSKASLTLLSSVGDNDNRMTAMRLVRVSGSEYWLDVYFATYSNATGPLKLILTGDIAVSDIQNPISITTDATVATAEISLNQNVSGTVLTDKSASKVGSFNIDTTQHPNAENNIVVRQFGKVVSINGYILRANLPNSNTSYRLGTLSNVSNPPIDIRTLCTIANAAYDNGDNAYLYIGTDRAIYLKTRTLVGSNMAVYFSVTYIAD